MSEYRAGDTVAFKYEGNLRGEVRRVVFDRGRVRYAVVVCVECEVPESLIVGREPEVTAGVEEVDPRGTSQRCVCGAGVPKDLKQRRHSCQACGLSVARDHASAMEILRLGLSLQALTYPAAESVA
jgi:hypothetical protein